VLVIVTAKRMAWGGEGGGERGGEWRGRSGVDGARERDPVLKGARERSPVGRGGGNEGELCSSSSRLREWLGEAREVEDAGVNGAVDPVLKGARERDPMLKG
jgi:hypothetical protein